jgi:hypothetical protein
VSRAQRTGGGSWLESGGYVVRVEREREREVIGGPIAI